MTNGVTPFRVLQGLGVATVLGLLGLLIWDVATQRRGTRFVSDLRADRKPVAPSFNLPVVWSVTDTWPSRFVNALDDGKVSPRELKGRPLVINFWASWCIPCRSEAPRFAESAREHDGEVTFLGVDVQDFKSDARSFLRRYHVNYVSVRDGNGSTYADYALTGVPETFWVDTRGRIIAHYAGEISRDQLERGIRTAINGRLQ